jgi:hypothetical protein
VREPDALEVGRLEVLADTDGERVELPDDALLTPPDTETDTDELIEADRETLPAPERVCVKDDPRVLETLPVTLTLEPNVGERVLLAGRERLAETELD